jgi:DNA-binding transcriptional ArsR family regulator
MVGGFDMAGIPHKDLTNEAFEAISQRFRVLSDPMRLKILYNLRGGELSVSDIVGRTGGSQSNVSKHLSMLLTNGMVHRRREGTSAFYSIADDYVFSLCDNVCGGIEAELEHRRRAFK